VAVELDGEPWRTLPVEAVVRAGLGVGRLLDRPLARTLNRELRRSGALAVATRALRTRDLSRERLSQRLERAAVTAEARDEALGALERAGLVDDDRVAAGRAAALAARGYGDAAIRDDLERRQGLSAATVDAALGTLEPEAERAARVVEKRGSSVRTARLLAGRGFSPESLEAALPDLIANSPFGALGF
jgi:SOS response regulatory protein OraA/RecX